MKRTKVRKRCKDCKYLWKDKDRRDGQPCPKCLKRNTIRIS